MAADTPKTRTVRLHGVEIVIEEGQNGAAKANRETLYDSEEFIEWAMSCLLFRLLDEAMETQP
jgi:hypothetical protein